MQQGLIGDVPIIYYNSALELARAGALHEARDKLVTALSLDPEMVDAHSVLGKVYAQMGQYGQAITCWEKSLGLDADNAAARARIAKAKQILLRQRRSVLRVQTVRAGMVVAVFLLGVSSLHSYRALSKRYAVVPIESVQTALRQSPILRGTQIQVVPGQGRLALKGEVGTEAQKELAQAIAERQSGVIADVSTLTVRKSDPLAQSLRNVLSQLSDAALRSVAVSQQLDTLALRGLVPSQRDKGRVVHLAKALVGVRSVDASMLRVQGVIDYALRDGDTLWDLAEHFYGDGKEWVRIADANSGRIRNPARIRTGVVLKIPPIVSIAK